jgi:hypothetical protein
LLNLDAVKPITANRMLPNLEDLDLPSVRNLFLQEMRAYLIAVDIETPDELAARKERIKIIDKVLEDRKRLSNSKDLDLV